jgi:hypothetical protein
MTGNNGTADTRYDLSVQARVAVTPVTAETGLFRPVVALNSGNPSTPYATYTSRSDTAASYADFSQSIDPYNSNVT